MPSNLTLKLLKSLMHLADHAHKALKTGNFVDEIWNHDVDFMLTQNLFTFPCICTKTEPKQGGKKDRTAVLSDCLNVFDS